MRPRNGLTCYYSRSVVDQCNVWRIPQSLKQVVNVYRSKLRDNLPGAEGDEVARKRIEDYANQIRPPGFVVRNTPGAYLLCAILKPVLRII